MGSYRGPFVDLAMGQNLRYLLSRDYHLFAFKGSPGPPGVLTHFAFLPFEQTVPSVLYIPPLFSASSMQAPKKQLLHSFVVDARQ